MSARDIAPDVPLLSTHVLLEGAEHSRLAYLCRHGLVNCPVCGRSC